MSEVDAYAYLSPSPKSFWRWDDDGRVLCWHDGATIGFLPEVHAAAQRFAATGLPPFGALALALAATRDSWSADESRRSAMSEYMTVALHPSDVEPGTLYRYFEDAEKRLDALAALPADLRRGPEARALLVEMFFEGVSPALPRPIDPILDILSQRVPVLREGAIPLASEHVAEAMATLRAIAGARMLTDIDSIRLRQRTGLEQMPRPIELPIADRLRGLLNQLRQDPELSGLAKLTRALMAVISTPRRLTPQADLPLGGFSDITNRGPLDRLLVTELAHDDLTVAVRVALNEALYLRRESPRARQAFTRYLLIDAGIRLWGIPRIFATAAGLAFAAGTPREATLKSWCSHSKSIVPVDLSTRAGLQAQLEILSPAPHPGVALLALAKIIQGAGDERPEVILITHPDVHADTAFRQALAAAKLQTLFLATVEAKGQFTLSSCSASGQKVLKRASVKLDDIMTPASDAAPLVEPAPDIPAFFNLPASPFLLPISPSLARSASSLRHGLVAVAKRDLLHWPVPDRPRRLATVPNGNFVGIGIFDAEGVAVVAVWDPLDKILHFTSVNLKSRKVVQQRITGLDAEPAGIGGHNGVFLVILKGRLLAYTAERGVFLNSLEISASARLVGSRFMEGPTGAVLAITYGGDGLHLVDVPLPPRPLAVFTRAGVDGPLAVYRDGTIHNSLGEIVIPAPAQLRHARISCRISYDGCRIILTGTGFNNKLAMEGSGKLVASATESSHFAVNLASSKPMWQPFANVSAERFLLGHLADFPRDGSVQLRRKIQSINVTEAGDLILYSRRNRVLLLQSDPPRLASGTSVKCWLPARAFAELPAANGPNYGLRIATWKDGSCAWMDPRGILHLRSSDPAIPELSILLLESVAGHTSRGDLVAWSSDGMSFGDARLLDIAPMSTPAILTTRLRNFARRLE